MAEDSYKLLEEFKLGDITLRNRIVLAPMGTMTASEDGSVSKSIFDLLVGYAKAGVGLVITEGTNIDDRESIVLVPPLLTDKDSYIPGLTKLADAVKKEGAGIICQISHAGRQTVPDNIKGLQPLAPSPIPSAIEQVVPKELDQETIIEIEDNFAASAARLEAAHFDGVELHGAHGYLLTEFLSPAMNKRKDKYGGSLENRARMILEICEKIRKRTKSGFILGYRISADDRMQDGISPEDVVTFSRMLEDAGVDYISVASGTHESMMYIFPPMYLPRGINLPMSRKIKEKVTIPVMCAGSLDPKPGEQAIRQGDTDLVAVGRGLLADPEFVRKLMQNREEDIRPCIRCNECMKNLMFSGTLSCTVNPGLGRVDSDFKKVADSKKVLVIGGGPGGMETARLAASLGHKVTIVEKENRLGGHLLEASAPEFKRDLGRLLKWLETQLIKENVDVRLSCKGTPEIVKQEAPEILVIAVGSEYSIPIGFSGDHKDTVFPHEVLLGKREIGPKVVVVGGGSVGCETALFIAETLGAKVTIVEMQDDILMDMEVPMNMMNLRMRLETSGVGIRTGIHVTGFSENEILYENSLGESQKLEADSVILAMGLTPRQEMVNSLESSASRVFKIGDCVQPKDVQHVFKEAWKAVFSF